MSLVRSDWASMSAPWLSRISTTLSWPAVAARISGVNPFLSRCSMSAPLGWEGQPNIWTTETNPRGKQIQRDNKSMSDLERRRVTSSSWPPAQARVRAVSWLLSVSESRSTTGTPGAGAWGGG